MHNLLGAYGAVWSDFLLQVFGISIFLLPIHLACSAGNGFAMRL